MFRGPGWERVWGGGETPPGVDPIVQQIFGRPAAARPDGGAGVTDALLRPGVSQQPATLDDAFGIVFAVLARLDQNTDLFRATDALKKQIEARIAEQRDAGQRERHARWQVLRAQCREALDAKNELLGKVATAQSVARSWEERSAPKRAAAEQLRKSRPNPRNYPSDEEIAAWAERVRQAEDALLEFSEPLAEARAEALRLSGELAEASAKFDELRAEEETLRRQLFGAVNTGPREEHGIQVPR